jgi:hypothetical protein
MAEEWEDLRLATAALRRELAAEWARWVGWFARPGPPAPGEVAALTILILALVLLATCEAPR